MSNFYISNNDSNNRPILSKNYNKVLINSPKSKYVVSLGGNLYTSSKITISSIRTVKNGYPDRQLFGIEYTTQNIYSAGPNKLRIGVF